MKIEEDNFLFDGNFYYLIIYDYKKSIRVESIYNIV